MSEPTNLQILEEASAWFVEFREGSSNERAREDFMAWLCRSPEHIRTYLEVSRLYVRLPTSNTVPASETERLLEKARARLAGDVIPLDARYPLPAAVTSHRRRGVRPMAAAAAALLLLGAIAFYEYSQRGLYSTGLGESRTVTLEDASRVELNAGTRLRVNYSEGLREVQLLEGQALFQVAKDKTRPFIVRTDFAQVRAVGTEFDVNRHGRETTVTVLDGTVALQPVSVNAGLATPADLLLTAGEQAVMAAGAKPKTHSANVTAATAWTRGELEFLETPLTQVVEEFNRSSPRRFVLNSQSLANIRISGVYSSADPTSLILFLRNQPDLIVSERGNEIRINPK
jgi:transmembrane sensor